MSTTQTTAPQTPPDGAIEPQPTVSDTDEPLDVNSIRAFVESRPEENADPLFDPNYDFIPLVLAPAESSGIDGNLEEKLITSELESNSFEANITRRNHRKGFDEVVKVLEGRQWMNGFTSRVVRDAYPDIIDNKEISRELINEPWEFEYQAVSIREYQESADECMPGMEPETANFRVRAVDDLDDVPDLAYPVNHYERRTDSPSEVDGIERATCQEVRAAETLEKNITSEDKENLNRIITALRDVGATFVVTGSISEPETPDYNDIDIAVIDGTDNDLPDYLSCEGDKGREAVAQVAGPYVRKRELERRYRVKHVYTFSLGPGSEVDLCIDGAPFADEDDKGPPNYCWV